MNAQEIIERTIKEKISLGFEYLRENKIRGERIGNPYALYWDDNNKMKVDIYQIEGVSDTPQESLPKWRRFFVEYINLPKLLEERKPFVPDAPGYNRGSSLYKNPIILI